jgi:hypothetical protein
MVFSWLNVISSSLCYSIKRVKEAESSDKLTSYLMGFICASYNFNLSKEPWNLEHMETRVHFQEILTFVRSFLRFYIISYLILFSQFQCSFY